VTTTDAVVVGSGPNGLAAAIVLAKAGLTVVVVEGAAIPGGGCRTEERTLPGFLHDTCSTIQALATASPFFEGLDLSSLGVTLKVPDVAFAHPLDGGRAGAVMGTVEETAAALGPDGATYRALLGPLVERAGTIVPTLLSPIRSVPPHPLDAARYALHGVRSVRSLVSRFETAEARALLAGVGAHGMQPLTAPITAGFALLLTMVAHTGGWPVVEGGSGRLVDALVSVLSDAGGTIEVDRWVADLDELVPARAVLADTSTRGLAAIAQRRLPARYARGLDRFRYGPGVCKVDWALSGPVPWSAEVCRTAGTVHVGGTFEEVADAERAVTDGRHPERPFCIVVQPCVADPTRAPVGQHTLWGYCHVPGGSDVDMTARIEAQIERFAPGFGDLVLARSTLTACAVERANPNYVGGDIGGGVASLRQTLFRPTLAWNPYRTPVPGLYLCSASTPPGGGVHGMCGVGAARTVLRDLRLNAGN
jgi:phytoene dehydrogenase-like protein